MRPGLRGIHPLVDFLAGIRIAKGLSQRDVQKMGGPNQPCLSQLENGIQQPTTYNLERLARVLGFRLALVDKEGNVYELPADVG